MANEQTTDRSTEIESIYESQGRELWAIFYAQCSDADRAYDALQEAFTRLHQYNNGEPIRDLRAWVLRVGRNWLHDAARRQKVAARSTEYMDRLAAEPAEPSSILGDRELHSRVREALGEQREEDREVLILRYALGWSSNRIAETLDTSASAVDMRLSRARKRLKETLPRFLQLKVVLARKSFVFGNWDGVGAIFWCHTS